MLAQLDVTDPLGQSAVNDVDGQDNPYKTAFSR